MRKDSGVKVKGEEMGEEERGRGKTVGRLRRHKLSQDNETTNLEKREESFAKGLQYKTVTQ